jgi:hypothetical protein
MGVIVMADVSTNTAFDQSQIPIPESTPEQALVERLWQDHELMSKLLLNKDISKVLKAEGFDLDENFLPWVELSVKKIRTYITDQLHFMRAQVPGRPWSPGNGNNNGAQDW